MDLNYSEYLKGGTSLCMMYFRYKPKYLQLQQYDVGDLLPKNPVAGRSGGTNERRSAIF